MLFVNKRTLSQKRTTVDPNSITRALARGLEIVVQAPSGAPPELPRSVDLWLEGASGGRTRSFAIETKSGVGEAAPHLRRHQEEIRAARPEAIPLLVVPRLSRADRSLLRAAGVNHMDLMGNMWIRQPDFYVNVEGKVARARSPRARRRLPNPFSKKASLVARILLAEPSRTWGVRELAEEASLSVGYASDLLKCLAHSGYAVADEGGYRLGDVVALLRDWCSTYRWEDNEIHSFTAAFAKEDLLPTAVDSLQASGGHPVLTLLSGVDVVMPHVEHNQVHLYVLDVSLPMEQGLQKRLHAEPVRQGGNLHVMVPYYRAAALFASQEAGGFHVVSDIQLFLDLVHYPVRGPEAARAILRQRLRPALGLDHSAVTSLEEALGL